MVEIDGVRLRLSERDISTLDRADDLHRRNFSVAKLTEICGSVRYAA